MNLDLVGLNLVISILKYFYVFKYFSFGILRFWYFILKFDIFYFLVFKGLGFFRVSPRREPPSCEAPRQPTIYTLKHFCACALLHTWTTFLLWLDKISSWNKFLPARINFQFAKPFFETLSSIVLGFFLIEHPSYYAQTSQHAVKKLTREVRASVREGEGREMGKTF